MGRWLDVGESEQRPEPRRQKNLEFLEFVVELPRGSAKSLRRVVFHCLLATVNRLLFTHAGSRVSPAFHFCFICSRPVMRWAFAPAAVDSGR
jgi:hypothetical protein